MKNQWWLGARWALAATVIASAGTARGDVDLTADAYVGTPYTKVFNSQSPEVVSGCTTAGSHVIAPIYASVVNAGDMGVRFASSPARVCNTCPCTTSPVNGHYSWSNMDCEWEVGGYSANTGLGFMDFAVTRNRDSAVTGMIPGPLGSVECMESDWRAIGSWSSSGYSCQNGNMGLDSGWVQQQGETPCRFIALDMLPGVGTYHYSVTANAASLVPEDRRSNNTVVKDVAYDGSSLRSVAGSWQAADYFNASANKQNHQPAIVSARPHHIQVFWKKWDYSTSPPTPSLHFLHKEFDHWEGDVTMAALPNGHVFAGTPNAVSWGTDRIDLFILGQAPGATGAAGTLWHTYTNDGGFTWGGWDNPAGVNNVWWGPTVVSWGLNRLDGFYTGADQALWHFGWAPGWFKESMGNPPGNDPVYETPAVVARAPNRLTTLVADQSGSIWELSWDSAWSGFQLVTNQAAARSPAALTAVRTTEMVAAFADNSGGISYTKRLAGWSGWSAPSSLPLTGGPARILSDISAVSWSNGAAEQWDFFVIGQASGAGSTLWDLRTTTTGSTWKIQSIVGAMSTQYTFDTPAPFSWGANQIDVAFTNASGDLGIEPFL